MLVVFSVADLVCFGVFALLLSCGVSCVSLRLWCLLDYSLSVTEFDMSRSAWQCAHVMCYVIVMCAVRARIVLPWCAHVRTAGKTSGGFFVYSVPEWVQ